MQKKHLSIEGHNSVKQLNTEIIFTEIHISQFQQTGMGLSLKFFTKSGPTLGLKQQWYDVNVHHSSIDVFPQLLIFTQPTGDSSCTSFHSPHCQHKLHSRLGVTSTAHKNTFRILDKKVQIEKTIYSHTFPSLQKKQGKKPTFTDTFPEHRVMRVLRKNP